MERVEGAPAGAGDPQATSLGELAALFLRLGATAFGGPAAHVAMMEDEVVRRRSWMSRAEFLDLLGATNLIPGPNSTELAILIGQRRAGFPGLVVAGVAFILPAALIVTALGWAYVTLGELPAADGLLRGVKPVVVVVVAQALLGFGRTAVRSVPLALLVVAAATAAAVGAHELLVLAAAGVAVAVARRPRGGGSATAGWLVPLSPSVVAVAATASAPLTLSHLFLVFLKIGSVLYGSGYVLLAFLRSELVHRLGWLTEAQLLDAVAVGQVTPGPLFTTATFVGYLLGGGAGAALATAGIFLPAFVFVALSGPLVPRIRGSPLAGAFLDGVNVASLALMAVVTFQLALAGVTDDATGALAIASAVLLLRYRVSSSWLVAGGAVVGALLLGS
jgi:chromate transporter